MEKKNDLLKTIIIAICAAVAAVGAIIVIAKVIKNKKAAAAICDCADECFDDECCCEFCGPCWGQAALLTSSWGLAGLEWALGTGPISAGHISLPGPSHHGFQLPPSYQLRGVLEEVRSSV